MTTTPADPAEPRPDPVEPAAGPQPEAASGADALPPDPAAYDSPRNEIARRRGLPQAYIAGGDDPELAETLRRERPYVRLLIAMVLIIVAMGFVLGIAAALLTAPR